MIRCFAGSWIFPSSATCSRTRSFIYAARISSRKQTRMKGWLPMNMSVRDELTLNNDQAFARQVSEAYYINCWQLFEGETLDMWKTYGQGLAVFSRFDLLRNALSPMLDDILLGIVRYGEEAMTGYNLIRFLYTKRHHFSK